MLVLFVFPLNPGEKTDDPNERAHETRRRLANAALVRALQETFNFRDSSKATRRPSAIVSASIREVSLLGVDGRNPVSL